MLESRSNDYCSSLVAVSAGNLSRTVKSDAAILNAEQAVSSASVSVNCVPSPARSLPSDVYPAVSVKQEMELSPQQQQSELMSDCRGNPYKANDDSALPSVSTQTADSELHDNRYRANDDGELLSGVQVKQEPSSPVSDISAKCPLLSSHNELVTGVPSVSTQTIDSELRDNWYRANDDEELLHRVQVKQEPGSPVSDIPAECPLSSSHNELVSAVPSVSVQTTDSELKVETSANRLTVTDVNSECDNLASTAAAVHSRESNSQPVDHKSGALTITLASQGRASYPDDGDVHVTSSSQSLTSLSESPQPSVSTAAVSLPMCNSLSASGAVVTNLALSVNPTVSVPQQLVRCCDSFGKMYYIPRSLLLHVQSSPALNCSNSRTACSPSSTCQNTSVVSVASSRSAGKSDVLPCVSDVTASTLSKPVVGVMSDGHVTTCSNVCTVPVMQSVVTVSLSHSVKQNSTLSSTALITVTTPSSTNVTTPLSAQNTSTLSHVSGTCISARSTPSNQRLYPVCLTSERCRDQVRMTGVPRSMLNNAVIKPRPLVTLCNVNSPAKSLPHITVLSTISSVVATSHNVTSVSSVAVSQRPTSQMTAKLATSSKSPLYFVIGNNNKVVSSSSHSAMEVVLVPVTKSSVVSNHTPQRTVCSVRPVTAAAVNGRCVNKSSTGLSQCDGVVRVSCSSVPSSPHSVTSTPALNRISKSCSSSQVTLLRPQHVASSTTTTKPSVVEPRAPMKRTSSSSTLNIFATKIGNQTVIVDIGSLSSSNSAPVKPAVTSLTSASATKPKNVLASRSASKQQDTTPVCENMLQQSSSLCTDYIPSAGNMDEVINCAAVIRYFNCFLLL